MSSFNSVCIGNESTFLLNISAIGNEEEINISTEYAFNDIFNMSEDDFGSSGDIPNHAESKDSIAPPTSESMSR